MLAWIGVIAYISVIVVFFTITVDWKDKQDILVGAGCCLFLIFVVVCGVGMNS